jgi:hypothetical protein
MNPNSFNCLHDSLMKQRCEDPYGSSVPWTIINLTSVTVRGSDHAATTRAYSAMPAATLTLNDSFSPAIGISIRSSH